MKKRIRTNGIIIFLAVVIIALFPKLFLRSERGVLNIFAEVFGFSFLCLGQLLRVCARGFKSENSANSHLLVTGGPYSLVRNPMYLGIICIGLGVVLVLFRWWAVCIFMVVFCLRYIMLIKKEEEKLTSYFGDKYREYKKKTPSLFPSLISIARFQMKNYLPLKWPWFKREMNSILPVLFSVLLLWSTKSIIKFGAGIFFTEAIAIFLVIIIFICLTLYLIPRSLPILPVDRQESLKA